MNGAIASTHRGKKVVLGRPKSSPHILGVARLNAGKLMDSFPTPADERDWIAAARAACGGSFGAMLNDQLGCCTIADGPGHTTQILTANTGTMVTPPDSAILGAYEKVDGYNPKDPSTDQGGVETVVLQAWKTGIPGFARLKLWVPIDPRNLDHLCKGVERYGSVYEGVALPLSAQNQVVWNMDLSDPAKAEANSWGGHAISLYKYKRSASSLVTVTWGMEQGLSIDWNGAYCDEAYIPFADTLWCPSGKSPLGDTVDVLSGALAGLSL